MIEQLEKLRDIDYSNLDYPTLVQIKKTILGINRRFKDFSYCSFTSKRVSFISEFKDFIQLTTVAYGYKDNKFKEWQRPVSLALRTFQEIEDHLSEEFLLENIDMYKKKRTFNPRVFLNDQRFDDNILEDYKNIVSGFVDIYKEYLEIKNSNTGSAMDKRINIYKQALRCDLEDNQFWGVDNLRDEDRFTFVQIYEDKIVTRDYYFDLWRLITSGSNTHTLSDEIDGMYKKFIKKVYPEMYL